MWSLAATVLSGCIVIEYASLKILSEMFHGTDSIMFLLMGFITLGIFTAAIIYLRKTAKDMEADYV